MICLGNILQLLIPNHVTGLTEFCAGQWDWTFSVLHKGLHFLSCSLHRTPVPRCHQCRLALSILLRVDMCQFYPMSPQDPYAPLVILVSGHFKCCREQLGCYLNSVVDFSIMSQGKQHIKCCDVQFCYDCTEGRGEVYFPVLFFVLALY